ncbi:GTPase Era [Haliscomenobacter sp.]|uniref:GTPase Era n=1 Tax=Haliscomenobacter sp. TaxID=2717303 RepID=UPI003BAB667C
MHRSGFINIIGHPNVGKSTLMNALVGERMSIITNKPQTTRHRIIGILSGEDFQMVLSDTPGVVEKPAYKMHQAMNSFVQSTFEDADLMLLVTDVLEEYKAGDQLLEQLRRQTSIPMFVVLNKIDLVDEEKLEQLKTFWAEQLPQAQVIPISALKKISTDLLLSTLKENLPEGPEYYPKDQLTDRPERFFMSEIVREKIMTLYHQEIPYATQVIIEEFKEDQTVGGKAIARISATIFVERDTQKSILIGKNGVSIKKLGMEARLDMEKFLEKKVFLELFVKVKDNWRNDDFFLKQFGYK